MARSRNKGKILLTGLAALSLLNQSNGIAGPFDMQSMFNPSQSLPPIDYRKKEPIAQELFPVTNLTVAMPQSIPLNGVKLANLNANALSSLGFNYFVVTTTDYADMTELYRENRLRGKGNLVTVDAILHPYIAFRNRVLADAIEQYIVNDMVLMLRSMLDVLAVDYKNSDDVDVRSDLERNIAYVVVALRLLSPQFQATMSEDVTKMVDDELKHIELGSRTKSAVLDRVENFAQFQPPGWYQSSSKLKGFYQCYTWLSAMNLPLADVTVDQSGTTSNMFRQSVLLFRALDLARVNGQPTFALCQKITNALLTMAVAESTATNQVLLPVEYKTVFATLPTDLSVTLKGLAEPFFRTKLMLTIRNRQPMNLSATSIFELGERGASGTNNAVFQLLPPMNNPEIRWMRSIVKHYPADPNQAQALWPLGLFVLHSRGAPQADNILSSYSWKLDPEINKLLPVLDRMTGRRNLSASQPPAPGSSQPGYNPLWNLLFDYFVPVPEGAQTALRTEGWLSRKLEGALAAWMASNLCIVSNAPKKSTTSLRDGEDSPIITGAAAGTTKGAPVPGGTDAANQAANRSVFDNYLEPSSETFRRMEEDARQLTEKLMSFGYFPERHRMRLTEFVRLAQRLKRISELELRGTPLSFGDLQLLANIDSVIEKVTSPSVAYLPVAHIDSGKGGAVRGINLALGRPALVYMIYQQAMKVRLIRGGVYNYYEQPGAPMTLASWQTRLDAGSQKPPTWAESFDIVTPAKANK